MKSFLLRFQEPTTTDLEEITLPRAERDEGTQVAGDSGAIVAGTQTITEVRAEAVDADPRNAEYSVIPKQNFLP